MEEFVLYHVHPTIVKTGFTVKFYSEFLPTFTLTIYNLNSGLKVYTEEIDTNTHYVNINHLKPGTYIVKFNTETFKIIKL